MALAVQRGGGRHATSLAHAADVASGGVDVAHTRVFPGGAVGVLGVGSGATSVSRGSREPFGGARSDVSGWCGAGRARRAHGRRQGRHCSRGTTPRSGLFLGPWAGGLRALGPPGACVNAASSETSPIGDTLSDHRGTSRPVAVALVGGGDLCIERQPACARRSISPPHATRTGQTAAGLLTSAISRVSLARSGHALREHFSVGRSGSGCHHIDDALPQVPVTERIRLILHGCGPPVQVARGV